MDARTEAQEPVKTTRLRPTDVTDRERQRPTPNGGRLVPIALRSALHQRLSGYKCKCGCLLENGLAKWHNFYVEFRCACNPSLPVFRLLLDDRSDKIDFIYFIEAPLVRHIKIGLASDVHKRLIALRMASPIPLSLLCYIAVDRYRVACIERAIHQKFAHLRVHGEWFRDSTDLRAFIEEASSSYDDFQRH